MIKRGLPNFKPALATSKSYRKVHETMVKLFQPRDENDLKWLVIKRKRVDQCGDITLGIELKLKLNLNCDFRFQLELNTVLDVAFYTAEDDDREMAGIELSVYLTETHIKLR